MIYRVKLNQLESFSWMDRWDSIFSTHLLSPCTRYSTNWPLESDGLFVSDVKVGHWKCPLSLLYGPTSAKDTNMICLGSLLPVTLWSRKNFFSWSASTSLLHSLYVKLSATNCSSWMLRSIVHKCKWTSKIVVRIWNPVIFCFSRLVCSYLYDVRNDVIENEWRHVSCHDVMCPHVCLQRCTRQSHKVFRLRDCLHCTLFFQVAVPVYSSKSNLSNFKSRLFIIGIYMYDPINPLAAT